jgi:putative membrane protein
MLGRILNYLIIIFAGRFVLDLFLSGEIAYLIHPRYIYFTVGAAIISIIVGFIGIVFNFKREEGKKTSFKLVDIVKLGLVFVLIYLPNFQINPLSSATFSQRSLDLNTLNMDDLESSELSGFVRNSENITLGEWVKAINLNPDLEDYVGKNVKVSGFVFKPDEESNLFMVSRFIVTCCAVDARPVGIFVDSDEKLRQDQWIEVKGVFDIVEINKEPTLVIKENEIKEIEIPAQPYIY